MRRAFLLLLLVPAATLAAETLTFKVVGIDCAGCGPPLVKALQRVDGVKSAKVNTKASTATVDVPASFDREKLRAAVSNIGFVAVFAGEQPRDVEPLPADVLKTLDIVSYEDGKRVDLAKVMAAGKVTVVDFYADWCGPCHVLETRLQHLMWGRTGYPVAQLPGGPADEDRGTGQPGNRATLRGIALRRIDIGKWDNDAAKQATELRAEALPYIRVYDGRGKLVAALSGAMWDEVLAAIEKAER